MIKRGLLGWRGELSGVDEIRRAVDTYAIVDSEPWKAHRWGRGLRPHGGHMGWEWEWTYTVEMRGTLVIKKPQTCGEDLTGRDNCVAGNQLTMSFGSSPKSSKACSWWRRRYYENGRGVGVQFKEKSRLEVVLSDRGLGRSWQRLQCSRDKSPVIGAVRERKRKRRPSVLAPFGVMGRMKRTMNSERVV